VAAVRRGYAGSCGVVGMTGLVDEYLRQLRASLRTRPEETSRILAEAEDHLRESVAAGRAAGLTEAEAAEAAISSFGTVRAVVRAHQTPRGQAAAALGRLFMATWLLAGIVLTSVFAVGLVMIVVIAAKGPPGPPGPDPDPSPGQLAYLVVACGLLGLLMLGSYSSVRRVLQRSRSRG
jgi:HAAS